jgi:hypothetical protein
MELNKDSWFVKYWLRWGCTEYGFYKLTKAFPDPEWGEGADLCRVGRIALIYAPLKTLAIAIPAIFLLVMIVTNPLASLIAAGVIAAILAAGLFIVWLMYKATNFAPTVVNSIGNSAVGQYYKSWKENYCQRVTFGGTSSNSMYSNTLED